MKYSCINIQGNFISEEVLQKVETASADFQKSPTDFGFNPGTNLRDEIEYSWSRIKLDWKHFSEKSNALPASDQYGTSLARKWMENFFSSIGFDLVKQKEALKGENNQTYTISHADNNINGLPAQIVGFYDPQHPEKNTLDIKSSGGTSRLSPHGTVQEYLNVTEHIYGFATNGMLLRLIRDSGRLVKLTYMEFDLKRMMDEDKYSEFTLLYRLIHASRFINEASIIEKYYQESIETGNRIRDGLSDAVKESMQALGNGFLQHPANEALREKLRNKTITPKQYYDQLRRLVYRLLFLMVTEERDLIYDSDELKGDVIKQKQIYLNFYSIDRLRKLSENRYLYEKDFTDLWQGLLKTFLLFEAFGNGAKIGIKPLDGDLFSETALKDIIDAEIGNNVLLECIRNLNEFQDKETKMLVSINYRSLDVEELGSVYEGLLELHPVIEYLESANPANIHYTFHGGTERKTTGSYYTRPDLVNELIKSALIPVIEQRVKEAGTDKKNRLSALLKLKVCDTAAGSGHIMLAAARTIAWYMARIDSGEENPAPSVYRYWLRQAIQHCIYAVDMNPDAVELCKLALWLEGHNSGKPLSFLDHKIRCGNSLVGVADLAMLKKGIPDEAFNPVTGDDKAVCQALKKANKEFNKTSQITLDFEAREFDFKEEQKDFAHKFAELDRINQDTLEEVKMISKKHNELKYNPKLQKDKNACDLYTAAFFYTYTKIDDPAAPSSQKLKAYLQSSGGVEARAVGLANVLSQQHSFFHWPLEFPDVFDQGGFDVMMGNPPWEVVELKEQEYFASKDIGIAKAENKAARVRLIKILKENNPSLYEDYEKESHGYDSQRKFIQESSRFILTAHGRINTYSIFSELFSTLINSNGRTGIIVPTGIATDDGNKEFFGNLVEQNKLVSLFDFENKEALFLSVHRAYKFCLLTLSGKTLNLDQKVKFGFFLTNIQHLNDPLRIFSLTKEDFLRLNPNTKTCPVFRTSIDAEITTKIYKKVPVLINQDKKENEWNISFKQGLFNMSSDSSLFKMKDQIEKEGGQLKGNCFINNGIKMLPLYEGKMCSHYNHRASQTYFNKNNANRPIQQEETSQEELQDASFISQPIYWVNEDEIYKKLERTSFLLGFRKVTSPTNERTVVTSIIPYSAAGDSMQLAVFKPDLSKILITCFCANFSSLPLDYVSKQKVGGLNLNFFYVNQFPIIQPNVYDSSLQCLIIKLTIELIYTAWDIKYYADDIWKEAGEDLRKIIEQQWKENKAVTGGNEFTPPDWCEINEEGIKLPPFKWDDERRALLKAELDAIYAKLYGLTEKELHYILDPQDVYGEDFPGETFRVLKDREVRKYGEYRTKRLVLDAWEKMK